MQQLLEEILNNVLPGIVLEDNTGAIFLMKNQQVSQRTKHIDVRHHFIRELRESGFIEPVFCRSEHNHADCQTKNLPRTLYEKHNEAFRTGKNYINENWDDIVKTALKTMPNNGQREDVENRFESIESVQRSEIVNYYHHEY